MDWSLKFNFDDEMGKINCFNGLFNFFAFHFQNSSAFMKKKKKQKQQQLTYCMRKVN